MRTISGPFGAGINTSCGTDAALSFYTQHGPFDVLYADPPWGSATLKYFQRAARSAEQLTEVGLAERLALIITKHITRYAFVLMGNKQAPRIAALLSPQVQHVELLPVGYYLTDKLVARGDTANLKSATLIVSEMRGAPRLSAADKAAGSRKVAYDLAEHFLRLAGPPAKMLDCCAGFGRYLEVAKKLGWRCYGSEINPTRFESLMEVITGVANPKADNRYRARS